MKFIIFLWGKKFSSTSIINVLQGGPSNIWNLYRLYKKNVCIFFQKYGFIRKIEPFHLSMKHNIIQMIATPVLTVPHSINPIFQYIFDCLGFNSMNGYVDFVFQGLHVILFNFWKQKFVEHGTVTFQ